MFFQGGVSMTIVLVTTIISIVVSAVAWGSAREKKLNAEKDIRAIHQHGQNYRQQVNTVSQQYVKDINKITRR
jgi:hypothetical protein